MKNTASARPHLPHSVIVKSPGLLPMLHTARELAVELRVPERTPNDWLNMSAPYDRNDGGRFGIYRKSCCKLQAIN
jgi:hypothetical protein